MIRAIFMGTGDIAIPALQALAENAGIDVVGLVTGEDKKIGRKQVVTPPAIKTAAEKLGITVYQPAKIRPFVPELEALAPDLIVVMAYGKILPNAVLDCPKIACWNLHASLLPRHRGASPIQAAIASGDPTTGVTVMHVAEELDAGDIILAHETAIGPAETGGELHDRLATIAAEALVDALGRLDGGTITRMPQDIGAATYLGKLTRADGALDWSRPAAELERQIRAFAPWPGTTSTLDGSLRLKIFPPATPVEAAPAAPGTIGPGLTVATGDGALQLTTVQPEGKRRMPADAFVAGYAPEGKILG